jgi:hypothetical protein
VTPRHLVAIYRRASFSPQQHLQNDRAILDSVVGHLLTDGWEALRIDEQDVEHGRIPLGELYLNMCQGAAASELLSPLEGDGRVIVNRPSSVLNCHRHRLVRQLAGSGVPFPRTLLVPSAGGVPDRAALAELAGSGDSFWLKRGDVHAERSEDVLRLTEAELPGALAGFMERDIPWAALQRHVAGPVLKFYALADRSFFRYYGAQSGPHAPAPPVDEAALFEVVFAAADRIGLSVFGGDVALPSPDQPVLIDLNDWPSFAPYRHEAGAAIAQLVHQQVSPRSTT